MEVHILQEGSVGLFTYENQLRKALYRSASPTTNKKWTCKDAELIVTVILESVLWNSSTYMLGNGAM